jgi:hypothetical protein
MTLFVIQFKKLSLLFFILVSSAYPFLLFDAKKKPRTHNCHEIGSL